MRFVPSGRGGKERGLGAKRAFPEASSASAAAAMRANERVDTGPELRLRSALHRRGYRFRVDLPVRAGGRLCHPDVVFTRAKLAVFVDGCFWHRCPVHGEVPASHVSYWGPKLERNVQRDLRNTADLTSSGWAVVRVWEHETLDEAVHRVISALKRRSSQPRSPSRRQCRRET